MKNTPLKKKYWTACNDCKGRGKKTQRLRKKSVDHYKKQLAIFEENGKVGIAPKPPKGHKYNCTTCEGKGVLQTNSPNKIDENLPHIAIIGGGIAGSALAVACLHRCIPFTLFERDENFNARSQGYGLTLQQASSAIAAFGILDLKEKINSTKHIVHNTKGDILGEWGMRKWLTENTKKPLKRTNIHVARQSLRADLQSQIYNENTIKWGHRLIDIDVNREKPVLSFNVNGKIIKVESDLVVGADGIRSAIRKKIIPQEKDPLRYLNCIVILGICKLNKLNNIESPLLDGETVFQTANGTERIYMMPFSETEIMWQLSFPLPEEEAINISKNVALALKNEAIKKTNWHSPIPEIIKATPIENISGYPVYDRAVLDAKLLKNANAITLIGDAAHPMSPFKGQGANQALLDALELARKIAVECKVKSIWETEGLRQKTLTHFEKDMIKRTTSKVVDSAAAAQFLHSDVVLQEIDGPRGKSLKK